MRTPVPPIEEIIFTAKVGFLTRRLWLKYFTKRSKSRNVRVWNSFVRNGFFKPHESKSLRNTIVLDFKSKDILESKGLFAVLPPHMNQVDHDEIVANFLINLKNEEGILNIETESEKKREFLQWMRTTREGRGAKFPDLTLILRDGSQYKRIAVELELSKKNYDRCKKMMLSYSNKSEIDAVVYIAEQKAIFDQIARAMKEINYPSWERPVGFSHLKDWEINPMSASIYLSNGVLSLKDWITPKNTALITS